jgi:hypothetical protein
MYPPVTPRRRDQSARGKRSTYAMNKSHKPNAGRRSYTLGELIVAVSESCRSNREAAAVIADLLESGQISFLGSQRGAHRRAR